jgi:hypothetical protein
MKEWGKIVPDLDRRVYEKAGYGKRQSFGGTYGTVLSLNDALADVKSLRTDKS